MQANEREKFNAMIGDVMAYYKQDVSSFAIGIWWEACKGCELEQVSKALSRHATDPERGQFPPKVADIVRILQGTPTDRAQIAWGKVLEAMQRIGSYTDVVFDDPAIHAVVEDMGGWPKLCRSTYDELSYLQHRFCESHKAYTRQETFQYPRLLMGDRSPDHDYTRRGLEPPKPAVIGNVETARLVYKKGEKGGKTPFSLANLTEQALRIGG
jgi:hypothetical protein